MSLSLKSNNHKQGGRTRASVRARPHANAGFNLTEVMIGLLISSISMLIIMKMFMLFGEQKKTSVSGDDAQTNGASALYMLQRDIRQAGFGVSAFPLIGCGLQLGGGPSLEAISPVTINPASIPAGDANTDTVLVVYGSYQGGPEGSLITAQTVTNSYSVDAVLGFSPGPPGDRVIAMKMARPLPCGLILDTVTGIDANPAPPALPSVTVQTGVAGMANGRLYNLGPAPKALAYAIRGGNLTMCDYMANDCGANGAVWSLVANNIVSLRAQYGRDTSFPMDAIVDVWDQATPSNENGGLSNNCGWARISAVRLVLVARNAQATSAAATADNPTWAASEPDNPAGSDSASAPIDLSGTAVRNSFTWRNYRYKVFETIVPIRNIALSGVQTGC